MARVGLGPAGKRSRSSALRTPGASRLLDTRETREPLTLRKARRAAAHSLHDQAELGGPRDRSSFQVLTPEQRQHFIDKGYVTVKGNPRPRSREEVDRRSVRPPRLRPGPDRSTWKKDIVWMDRNHMRPSRTFLSPKAWGALCRRLRWRRPHRDNESHGELKSQHFPRIRSTRPSGRTPSSSTSGAAQQAVVKPSADDRRLAQGREFLPPLPRQPRAGSADRPLLVRRWPQGRRHVHRPDSIAVVARYLADHPEGVDPAPISARSSTSATSSSR